MLKLLRFVYLWGTIGFFAGTLTLLGPVRWMTTALRARGGAERTEDLLVRAVIVLLLAGTGYLAWRLARRTDAPGSRGRWGVPLATTALAGLALVLWMNPRLVNSAEEVAGGEGERFVFGPYPDRERLAELKRRGFTGVISLLHPAVVPFEPRLIAQENAAARAVGIPLIHTPMLPWISENESSVQRLRALAKSDGGRYYVHCYLGKDRVNVVRRILRDSDVPLRVAEAENGARRIADVPAFERGGIYHFGDSVHVAPYPTDEEWVGYVLSGSVRQVLSLLDPANPEDTVWIRKEQELARRYSMRVESAPIRALPYDPAQALAAVRHARARERPLMVHAFRSVSPATEAFVQAWRTGLPPLPPSLYAEPMRGGAARVLGANVAAGPRPAPNEFGAYLHQRGVRGIVYLGPSGTPEARADAEVARSAGLAWHSAAPGPRLDALIAAGGPWYLYGPSLAAALPALDARLDPGVPPP
ncbi:MAG TPA: hypothetical protein VF584_25695 [Longimicrobium sp.]|jgi:protein tyrosine phosphatase (PTP) superfamily phosphohydrolase (DUF442 family)